MLTYGQREMRVILKEHAKCLSQVCQFEGSDIPTVIEYVTLGRVVNTRYQFENGAFAGPIHPNEYLCITRMSITGE